MIPAKDLDETLATIAKHAKALRDAGVTGRVSIGLICFELASAEPPPPAPVAERSAPTEEPNPLDDPATYGGHTPTRRPSKVPLIEDTTR